MPSICSFRVVASASVLVPSGVRWSSPASVLRDLQRRFNTAVVLVHHARKSAAARPGQALRGSSELHAWGDSNLYLRRRKGQIVMIVEHRAAPGFADIELADDGQGAALRLRHDTAHHEAPQTETPEQRIVQVLVNAEQALSQRQIRERAATRHTTVATILGTLVREGRVEHDAAGGYRIVATATKTGTAPSDAANGARHQMPCGSQLPVPASPKSSREPVTGTAPFDAPPGARPQSQHPARHRSGQRPNPIK